MAKPTILLDLREELSTDKLPFIGLAAEWTRKIDDFLGGNISSEISVARNWAQATIKWRGQQFVILMTSPAGSDQVDCLDCTKLRPSRQTVAKVALWGTFLRPILEETASKLSTDWKIRLGVIQAVRH
jgi:hypothetical protein